ncbi:exopolysaccharide biosynthesis polyprenyl glycosylphosphotransferase [Paenarthrobacter nicotinovorans]|uniref:sugar transferase n=1 Tax=Micrococcaceae TaxID=1268 RepID=UPI0004BBB820|nr:MULTISPECIES: sugar transferase [Micrococcaceae]MDR6435319.1 exopolysaccharide biosynthesis polyprenyl glycosylphosphotransferase [Paenarthrobacter nicotinovorans]SCZ49450.1 Undecaprenyl-phosphate galactose phosphotransferase, WbaP/exopolysaccharide biosynthesis polyprenyl glycosylphosphotransferase [Arthrobacter sp. UNCCL28]
MTTFVSATREVAFAPGSTWLRAQSIKMRFLDLACIVIAVGGAHLLRFGTADVTVAGGDTELSYTTLSVVLILTWTAALEFGGTRDPKVLGTGSDEYKRVAVSSLWLFGCLAVVSYVFQLQTARGYVSVALPLGVILLLTVRFAQRRSLHRSRLEGQNLHKVLLIGAPNNVNHLSDKLNQHIVSGYKPVAALLSDSVSTAATNLPVLGSSPSVEMVLSSIDQTGADTVAVCGGAHLDPAFLRQLGWALSARDIGMIVAPALTDISGPRIHMQPVAGLPLIHVTTPKLSGMKAFAKRALDVCLSSMLLLLLAVPMLVIAILVKLDSPGSAFFFQERIGKGGQSFKMIKFRSMRNNAETLLEAFQAQSQDSVIFFKMKDDPRVTRLGAWIRRYSIDELPQLLNVLNGTMSLVGPRPQVAREVEMYDFASVRRLLVKPGMTGLWQVSGRNDLSLEESIRLDLYYVENWSLAQDIVILFRTAKAVVGKDGAY